MLLPLILLLLLPLLLLVTVVVQEVVESVVELEVDAGNRDRPRLPGLHPGGFSRAPTRPVASQQASNHITELSGHSAYVFPRAGGEHGTSSGVPTLRI